MDVTAKTKVSERRVGSERKGVEEKSFGGEKTSSAQNVFGGLLGVSLGARLSIDGCETSGKRHLGHTPMKQSVSISANLP